MPKIYFLNGTNANLYGLDTMGAYGTESYPQIKERCEKHAKSAGIDLDFARLHQQFTGNHARPREWGCGR